MLYELKELSLDLLNKDLYDMYQDIPNGDNGQTNDAFGLNEDEFKDYIIKQINRKNNKVTFDDTPTITYIMYVENKPVGFICLRTEIDDNWMKWSGNFYYQVRVSERKKGYATKMLELGLNKLKELGFDVVYGQSSAGNIGSAKTIEKNKGIFIKEDNGTRYYKIILKKLSLYIPELEDYWYEEKLQSDPDTMSYNAGYDVSYYGYHYDTGCIYFPESKWEETYNKRKNENRFFAYIKDNNLNKFIGYCNYHYNVNDDNYECGLVIESTYRGKGYSKDALKLLCEVAKKNGIKELYDGFEIDRGNTLKVFESVGFKVIKKSSWIKFGKQVNGVKVKIEL